MSSPAPSAIPRPTLVPKDRLDSWKEIAAYLKRGERTVQRWEREQGLPVHRLTHNKQGSIYAYKSELDAWWSSRGTQIEQRDAALRMPASTRGRWVWLVVAACLAVTAAAVVWSLWPARPGGAALDIRPLTSLPGSEVTPSFSPDGNSVAFAWDKDGQGNYDVYVQPVGSGSPLRLTNSPSPDISPVWSPDGRWIAFIRLAAWGAKDALMLVPSIGGPERQVAGVMIMYEPGTADPPLLAWTRDGKSILVGANVVGSSGSTITMVSAVTGAQRALTTPPAGSSYDRSPAVSPDGAMLAFTRCRAAGICDLYVLNMPSPGASLPTPRALTRGEVHVTSPVWAANGREILFASGAPWEVRTVSRIPVSGGGRRMRETRIASDVQSIALSPKGDLVYTQESLDSDIWKLTLAQAGAGAGRPEKILASTRADTNPDLSPDGKRVAFISNRTGNPEVWTAGVDGSSPAQVTYSADRRAALVHWSPDGQFLVYTLMGRDTSAVCVVRAGGGTPNCLTDGRDIDSRPSWSRDGKSIYFVSHRSGKSELWRMPAAGPAAGAPVQITRNGAGSEAFESLDGKYLYYSRSEMGIFRIPLAGGEEEHVAGLDSLGRIALCRQGIYFMPWPAMGSPGSLTFLPYGGSKPVTLAAIGRPLGTLAASSDGRTVLYSTLERRESDLMLVRNFK